MAIQRVDQLALEDKRVFVRVDFNVPQDDQGQITDGTRIQLSLPTIRWVIKSGGKTILASHLGRPKGKRDPKFSLGPVAERLSQLLEKKVALAGDCVGEAVEKQVQSMKRGE